MRATISRGSSEKLLLLVSKISRDILRRSRDVQPGTGLFSREFFCFEFLDQCTVGLENAPILLGHPKSYCCFAEELSPKNYVGRASNLESMFRGSNLRWCREDRAQVSTLRAVMPCASLSGRHPTHPEVRIIRTTPGTFSARTDSPPTRHYSIPFRYGRWKPYPFY